MIKKIFLYNFLGLVLSCSLHTRELDTPPEGIKISKGQSYLSNNTKPDTKSEQEILSLLQVLVDWTLKKDYSQLTELVDPKKGVFPDLKSEWSYEKLQAELKNPNSYFETFFFQREKLLQEVNNKEAMTVRELIILSGGLKADLFFESKDECEVKLHFIKDSKYKGDLNNPYFLRINGKWKIYRLF
jgi:hypothetical protein